MSGGAWSNDSVSTLVIPTGATTGARVVLNGITGQIQVYNSANTLVAQIDSAGIETFSATGLQSTVTMHDGEIDIFPSHIAVATLVAAVLSAINNTSGPFLQILSPQQLDTLPHNVASMLLRGANAVSNGSLIALGADSVSLAGFGGGTISVGSDQGGVGGVVIVGGSALGASQINVDSSLSGPNTIDFLTANLTRAGVPIKLLSDLDNFDASATLTLAVASAAIPGCSHTYPSVLAGAKWQAIGTFDCGLGAVANTDVGELWVNANGAGLVKQTGDASYNGGVNTRSGITRSWSGTVATTGSMAFQLQGRQAGAGGVNVMANPGTTLQIAIFQ